MHHHLLVLFLLSLSTAALGLAPLIPNAPLVTPAPEPLAQRADDEVPGECANSRFLDCASSIAISAWSKCDAHDIVTMAPDQDVPKSTEDCICAAATSMYQCYTKECAIASDFPSYYSAVEECAATLGIGEMPAEPTGQAAKVLAEYNGEEVEDSAAAASLSLTGGLGALVALAFVVGWFVGA